MNDPTTRPIAVCDLGIEPYLETLARQHAHVAEVAAGRAPDTLFLVEHPPVITLGRQRASAAHVLASGDTPVVQVERGGDVTWHGPGQLVGYPIVRLAPNERDVHQLLRRLEVALVEVLASVGLAAAPRPGHTGVWVDGRKVASLGVAVRDWVTFHGFALNVSCDLAEFARIQPCGFDAGVMASIASLGAPVPPRAVLVARLAAAVAHGLGRRLVA